MRTRVVLVVVLTGVVTAALLAGVGHFAAVDHWLAVHTGTVDGTGPYYAFWSGFGSDLTEFGVIGAVVTAVYQLARKFNCHEQGCWRVGNHPAADGQFHLCYQHHPDYQGRRPTRELIDRLHQEHRKRETLISERLHAIHRPRSSTDEADAPASVTKPTE